MREVTDRADVAVGAFYHHFATKEELITAVVQDTVAALASPVIARAFELDDPAETAAISHRWFIGLATREPRLAQLIVHLEEAESFLGDTFRDQGRQVLMRGAAAGRFRELDIEVTLTFTISATVGVVRSVLEGRLPTSAVVASTETFLCALGIEPHEAADISRRNIPGFPDVGGLYSQ